MFMSTNILLIALILTFIIVLFFIVTGLCLLTVYFLFVDKTTNCVKISNQSQEMLEDISSLETNINQFMFLDNINLDQLNKIIEMISLLSQKIHNIKQLKCSFSILVKLCKISERQVKINRISSDISVLISLKDLTDDILIYKAIAIMKPLIEETKQNIFDILTISKSLISEQNYKNIREIQSRY